MSDLQRHRYIFFNEQNITSPPSLALVGFELDVHRDLYLQLASLFLQILFPNIHVVCPMFQFSLYLCKLCRKCLGLFLVPRKKNIFCTYAICCLNYANDSWVWSWSLFFWQDISVQFCHHWNLDFPSKSVRHHFA